MKQFNWHVFAIILFEGFLGGGTMEWISDWADELRSAIWFVFGAYALVLFGIGFLILYLTKYIPEEFIGCTMFDYFLGRRIGAVFNILLFGALLIFAVKALLMGVYLIHYTTLPYSPLWVLVLFALIIPLQLLNSGIDALLRFQAVTFYPALILAVLLLLVSFRISDFGNLLPVLPTQPLALPRLVPRVSELLSGIALLVVFPPLFKSRRISFQSLKRGFFYATIGILLLNLLNLLVVLSVFGPFEASTLQWTVLEVVRLQKIPGIFLERLDLIFLLPVLVAVVSAININLFGAYHVLSHYGNVNRRWGIVIVLGTIILLAFVLSSLDRARAIYESIDGSFELILIFLIPVMYFTSIQRHLKGN